jgi:hypothetical protein
VKPGRLQAWQRRNVTTLVPLPGLETRYTRLAMFSSLFFPFSLITPPHDTALGQSPQSYSIYLHSLLPHRRLPLFLPVMLVLSPFFSPHRPHWLGEGFLRLVGVIWTLVIRCYGTRTAA